MSESIIVVLGLIVGVIGTILLFVWFDWKLALILFLLFWSNNISMRYAR